MGQPSYGSLDLGDESTIEAEELEGFGERICQFGFPGLDGVFSRGYGAKGRGITWRCTLRAANDTAMQTVLTAIETAIKDQSSATYTAADGRQWTDVTTVGLDAGRRRIIRGGDRDGWILRSAVVIGFYVPVP